MPTVAEEFASEIATQLVGASLSTCSRWAKHRRVMGGDFAGPYSWRHHPWVKELHDTNAPFNYAMKGAQLGVTEVAINRAFYAIDVLKKDCLYVLPTALNAADFSKARFGAALQFSPYLKNLFTDTNTVGLKRAAGNNLYIRGSRGDSNLVSIPVSELLLDEVDRMDQKQVWLALERLSGHLRKSVWGISTPTIPGYGIHKLFLTGTQEHFHFQCPRCSRWTELVWPDCVEIIGDSVYDVRCAESYLKCKECKGRLEHAAKPDWLASAEWRPTAVNHNPDIRSFHISQLYSYTVTPGEIVVAYHRGLGDEAANTELHNSKLGLPFIGDGAKITDEDIDQCIGNHTMDEGRPKYGENRLIELGVDQGKTSYYTITEHFVDQFSNDINVAAHAKVLCVGKFLDDEWDKLDELMHEWRITCCVIDADPEINEARRFAKKYPDYVYLTRYRQGKVGKEIGISEKETGAPMAVVDRTNWCSATMGRFKRKRILLPRDVPREFREHCKALVRTYVKDDNGNPIAVYVSTGPDHFAHSLVYSEIALPLAAHISTGSDIEKFL